MSSEVKNFIDKLSAGKNVKAGKAFKDALRDKVASIRPEKTRCCWQYV